MDDWFPAMLAGVLLFSSVRTRDYRAAMFTALAFAVFFLYLRKR